MSGENFDLIPQEIKDNYAAIVAEREVSFDSLADGVERNGDRLLAAYLRAQSTDGKDKPKERRQAAPKDQA